MKREKTSDKTLRIFFSGISTLTPGRPRNGEKPPAKAFVMMAANIQQSPAIADHDAFICVAPSLLVNAPEPDERTGTDSRGDFIYYFRDARVRIQPRPVPGTRIQYFMKPELPLSDRPGSFDVAPASDIRWLADLRDFLSSPPSLKKTVDPSASNVSEDVVAVVDLEGGVLKANFPCDSVHARAIANVNGEVISMPRRVLASEFVIDIPMPDTDKVTITFDELRKHTPITGHSKLVLKWPEGKPVLKVRMGYDTRVEVRRLGTPERCDPMREEGPTLKVRDDEFELHYNLLQDPEGRPVPLGDPRQCGRELCKPAMA